MIQLAVALAVAAAQPGSASAAVQKATDHVRTSLSSFTQAQGKARQRARDEARAAVAGLIDFETLAKATLGPRARELEPAQLARYTRALRGAMEASYLARMQESGGKSSDVAGARAELLGEESRGTDTLVHTKVKAGEDTAAIDYVMEKGPKGWRAIDVLTEGVSLVETYRDQVAKLWPKKGFAGVVAALERKQKQFEQQSEAGKSPAPGQ